MRTIKFRGKDIETGEWIYGNIQVPTPPFDKYFMWDCDHNQKEVTPNTVGQFMGLLDKNGKDIYEGYIMNDPTSKCVGVVEWNSILCSFQLSWQNMPTAADLFFMVKCGSFVIGNIHDNPFFDEDSDCDYSVETFEMEET